MSMGFGKACTAAAIVIAAASVTPILSSQVGVTIDNQTTKTAKNSATAINKNSARSHKIKVSSMSVSPSSGFKRFLLPVTKQTFKQNRRNELNKSRKKKNKQF